MTLSWMEPGICHWCYGPSPACLDVSKIKPSKIWQRLLMPIMLTLSVACWKLVLTKMAVTISAGHPYASHLRVSGNSELTRLLLGAGADKDCKDESGMTALMLASDSGHL